MRQRDYIDVLIDQGEFASYGHALRALLHKFKVLRRENAKLRTTNARYRERLELWEHGVLQAKTGEVKDNL